MDIRTRKIEFVQEFLKIQNEDLITRLEKILRSDKSSDARDIKPMTIAEFNQRINKSLTDSSHDSVIISDDLLAEIEKWD